jgi:hypothetical protein
MVKRETNRQRDKKCFEKRPWLHLTNLSFFPPSAEAGIPLLVIGGSAKMWQI